MNVKLGNGIMELLIARVVILNAKPVLGALLVAKPVIVPDLKVDLVVLVEPGIMKKIPVFVEVI